MFSKIQKYPKLSATLLLLVIFAGYWCYSRIPSAVSCGYEAMARQSVPWDLWRFNSFTLDCQYFNGTRWIELKKVMDVGGDVGDMEIE